MKIRRILVPTDFSTYSHDALEYAIELAKPFKAELVALFVVEPAQYSMASMYGAAPQVLADLLDEQTRTGRAQLSGLQQRLQKRRIKLRTLLRNGAPYEAIVEAAKRLKADLIVMATHGRTGLSHFVIGSVAERVVRTASCPVLTLHAAETSGRQRRPAKGRKAPRNGR